MSTDRHHLQLPATILAGLCGAATFNLAPLFLPAAARSFHLSDREIGLLMGVEVGGLALASILTLLLIPQLGCRRVAAIGFACVILGNGLSGFATDAQQLLPLRFLTGLLGDGLVYSAAIVALGRRRNPTGAFALLSLSNMCFTALILAAVPWLIGVPDWQFMTGLLCMVALPGLLLFRFIDPQTDRESERTAPGDLLAPTSLLAFAALFAFSINLGAVWTYLERIGNAAGLEPEQVSSYLSISLVCQAAGSLSAAVLSLYCKRLPALFAAFGVQLLSLGLLAAAQTPLAYLIAVSLWGFSWNLGIANMLGSLAHLGETRRLLPLVPGTEAMGVSLGPVLVAVTLTEGSYASVHLVGGIAVVFSIGALLGSVRRRPSAAVMHPTEAHADENRRM